MTASSTLYLDRRCNVHRYLLECLETKLNIIYFNQTTLTHPLIVNYIEEQKNLQKLSHLIFYAPCSLLRCRNERCCCCKTLTTVHFVTRIAQLFFVKSIHEQLSALPDQHIIKFRAINLKQGYLQPIKINIKGLKMHLYYDFQGTNYGSNGMGKNSLHFQIHTVSLKNVIFQTLSVPWTMSEMVKYKDSEL